MKKGIGVLFLAAWAMVSLAWGGGPPEGKALFVRHCGFCHPGGRNVIRPTKSLDRKTLLRNGITSTQGIVQKMRHPGPGMPQFSKERLSDEEAQAIATYVWETFGQK